MANIVKHDPNTIQKWFDDPKVKNQLTKAMPSTINPDRLLRIAMTAIRTNQKLMQCTQRSLMASVMGCAVLGLEPEPFLGQAYLVPFKNKWGQLEAQLIPGYRGYISLARRSGEVQSLSAQCVYENDEFVLKYGLNETLDHTPADGPRGELKGAYVIFKYKDGSHSFDYMTKADIDAIRARSKAKNSGPWVTDYDEMAKKTVIRRHVKVAPLSVEMAQAAQAENMAIVGESQTGLFLGMDEEVGAIDIPGEDGEFDQRVAIEADGDEIVINNVAAYVDLIAKKMSVTEAEVKESALQDWDAFWSTFKTWKLKKAAPPTQPPATGGKASKGGEDSSPPPPPKRAADMNTEELTIHRIKKASKTTIERVVRNNIDNILASEEATQLAMAKWEANLDIPWPGKYANEGPQDAQPEEETAMRDDDAAMEAQKLLIDAAEQFGQDCVTEAVQKLGYEGKQANLDMAAQIYDKALEIYQVGS